MLDTMLDAVRPAGVVVNVSIWGAPASLDMQKLVLKDRPPRDHRLRPGPPRRHQDGAGRQGGPQAVHHWQNLAGGLVEQGFDTLINRLGVRERLPFADTDGTFRRNVLPSSSSFESALLSW
ncbi:UNVERIFIED_ORG: hypothetical protein ABIB52_000274 [Arthrobacter sp. UYCu721]